MDFFPPVLASVFVTWSPCVSRADVAAGCARACLQYPWCEGYSVSDSSGCFISGEDPGSNNNGGVCGTNVSVYHSGDWHFRNVSGAGVSGCFYGVCRVDETYDKFPLTDAEGPALHVIFSGATFGRDRVLVNRSHYTNVSGSVDVGTIYVRSGDVSVAGGLRTVLTGADVDVRVRSAMVVAAGDASRVPMTVRLDVEVFSPFCWTAHAGKPGMYYFLGLSLANTFLAGRRT